MAGGDEPPADGAYRHLPLRPDPAQQAEPDGGGREPGPYRGDGQHGDRRPAPGGEQDQGGHRPGRRAGADAPCGRLRRGPLAGRPSAGADHRPPAGELRRGLHPHVYGYQGPDKEVSGGGLRLPDAPEPERAPAHPRGVRRRPVRPGQYVLHRAAGVPQFRLPDGEVGDRADRQRRHPGGGAGAGQAGPGDARHDGTPRGAGRRHGAAGRHGLRQDHARGIDPPGRRLRLRTDEPGRQSLRRRPRLREDRANIFIGFKGGSSRCGFPLFVSPVFCVSSRSIR